MILYGYSQSLKNPMNSLFDWSVIGMFSMNSEILTEHSELRTMAATSRAAIHHFSQQLH
jgi:hypothetical protein